MMKRTTALFVLFSLFLLSVAAQEPGMKVLQRAAPSITPAKVFQMRTVCNKSSGNPLFVVDGIIIDEFEWKNIDPNDIESISILKDAVATVIYCQPGRGVVVITTKNANQRIISVKDMVSGEPLAAATVDLIYGEDKHDTIRLIADPFGRVVTDRIVYGKEYKLIISSVGYKTCSAFVNAATIKRDYSVLLEKVYGGLRDVTVTAIRCGPRVRVIKCSVAKNDSTRNIGKLMFENKIKVYPNPVMNSQMVNIEFEGKQGKVTVRLFSLEYQLINAKEYDAANGLNRISFFIDPRLSSGMYLIQLFDEKNLPVKTERLVVQ